MILFKTNFCTVFLTINLVHNSFSVDDKKTNDEILLMTCKKNICKHFKGSCAYKHGQQAFGHLSLSHSENKLNADAMDYYKSFELFLEPGEIQPPAQFCQEFNSSRSITSERLESICIKGIELVFGSDLPVIIQKAFYSYTFDDMNIINIKYPILNAYAHSTLKFYFRSIRDHYSLNHAFFDGPIKFCCEKYSLPGPTTASSEGEKEVLDPIMEIDPHNALSIVFK